MEETDIERVRRLAKSKGAPDTLLAGIEDHWDAMTALSSWLDSDHGKNKQREWTEANEKKYFRELRFIHWALGQWNISNRTKKILKRAKGFMMYGYATDKTVDQVRAIEERFINNGEYRRL